MKPETWGNQFDNRCETSFRCKRGDGDLSSERMPGKTKSMTTKKSKHHCYYSPRTVNKIQHHSLPVYITVVLHLSHS